MTHEGPGLPRMNGALVVAILGAEGTGKTTLARALAERMAALSGLCCAWVPEAPRAPCEREGRRPRADEYATTAREQQARIEAAAATHELVIADTTPLLAAARSELLCGDPSLLPMALQAQRGCALTLLTALDLPAADPPRGDGAPGREALQRRLRALLAEHRIGWSLVGGLGPARTEAALDAVAPLLRPLLSASGHAGAGLFSRLAARDAAAPRWTWACEKCDVPECEHAALRAARPD